MQGNGGKQTMNTDMTMYQNQSKQVTKVRLPYYGTNKCRPTELFPAVNQTT